MVAVRRLCALVGLCLLALLVSGLVVWLGGQGRGYAAAQVVQVAPKDIPQICGSWEYVPSADVAGGNNSLAKVAAISPTDVWAVGYFTTTTTAAQMLIEHWDGTGWSLTPSPGPGTLTGIAAVSPSDIWAVGYTGEIPGAFQTLAVHWDGATWNAVAVPNPLSGGRLMDVAVVSADDAWAVGYFYDNIVSQTLTLHWDGSTWSQVTSPNAAINNELSGVWARTTNDVWAVGAYVSDRHYVVLTEHWDGAQWSVVSSPVATGYLFDMEGTAANDAWAVGYYVNAGVFQTYALHWDGSVWTQVLTPNPGLSFNFFYGLTAIAPDNVWATGTGSGTLTEHWDGSTWSVVPSPNLEGGGALGGIDALPDGTLWAAGDYFDYVTSGLYRTLIERYGDPCITQTPTPTGTATQIPSATGTGTRTSTPTVTGVATNTRTATPTGTQVATSTQTATAVVTVVATATATPGASTTTTPCPISFSDVHETDYFYEPVRYLYCAGAVSGYADGTFRPYNNTTRVQLSKIVVLAEGFSINVTGGPHFSDVPESSPFYAFVETAYNRGLISGYSDGTFRPGNNVTRAQLCKIMVLAEAWSIDTGGGPHFSDVPESNPFYAFVETAFNHGVISGYADGTFRPGSSATRGQICKIVYNSIR